MSFRSVLAGIACCVALSIMPIMAHAQPTRVDSGSLSSPDGTLVCTFDGLADNPHVTDGEVSVHGWWGNVVGNCGTSKATVVVTLQIYRLGIWWDVATSAPKSIYAGGGSGNRVNARVACQDSQDSHPFRGKVDVDLDGVPDTPWSNYGPEISLKCFA